MDNFIKNSLKPYFGILLGLLALIIVFSVTSPKFFEIGNFMNILLQSSIIAISSFGMTFALIIGGIDLSIGSTIALAGTIIAILIQKGMPLTIALLGTLIVGIICGAFNGTLIAKAHIPAFIVTVATMGIFRGITYLLTGGVPISIDNKAFLYIGNGSLGMIPFPVVILIILFIFMQILLGKTRFGRHAYVIGGNEEAARYAGIDVENVQMRIYMITSLMATVSGIILASRLYSAQPNAGSGYELDAIAAAVLGGTSLSGGYGTITGTFIGAMIMGVINNGMNLLNMSYFYQLIVKGIVILIAVFIDVQNKRKLL
ncbi:ABC transporter permease [Thermoanaerobacter wiegelii]|uniref:ABC-type transporter, integral membrane subunit n=1 Tax=Thermoanaerobacter wiegelii Rt8.B1 TaxID=697303 RepID=G2MTS2_9THEO|nr:ABC transporter permease [Thermoanaerobacter wiegelii]AEM79457.1 ABC-type transporter, integral membrane subunit [Thermoanaerobacter wiegelii Rt8.B1]